MTSPECTACHGGADYRLDLRDAPTPYHYCAKCWGEFLDSLDKLPEDRRIEVMKEVGITPIEGNV